MIKIISRRLHCVQGNDNPQDKERQRTHHRNRNAMHHRTKPKQLIIRFLLYIVIVIQFIAKLSQLAAKSIAALITFAHDL
jgi:uncharacterized membrane protein